MSSPSHLYRHSLALLTDLYQLTMAYGYWKLGLGEKEAVFHLTFRRNPFDGGYTIAAGLEYVIDFLEHLRFDDGDVAFLGSLRGNDEQPLFDGGFLDYLRGLSFSCDVDAIPEGTVVFPHEPLLRVRGPILMAQIIETPLLNMINFQSLVATKSTRICRAAKGESVLEFGLRRAQGIDGALAASRAAFIGGCAATSNVLAARLFDIPVKGTHAHSWVMSFDSELEAFHAYAKVMPNNSLFLVDTYDTLQGIRNAVEVGQELRDSGHNMLGVRLDSGDLAYFSIEARQILDEGGFPNASIVASNELDEEVIASLKDQGAKIDVWGVGTRLVTSYDQPALGGVYKLGAIRKANEPWRYVLKLSEQPAKTSNPGVLQVRRFRTKSEFVGDAIYNELDVPSDPVTIVDPTDPTRRKTMPADSSQEDLLIPIFRAGSRVYQPPSIHDIRRRVSDQLAALHPSVKRFLNPHGYPVGLERRLHELKTHLTLKARGFAT